MKDVRIILCTPDINRPVTRKAIDHLKNTDLSRAELLVIDNCFDADFRHAVTMDSFLRTAESKSIIFLDDDVFIGDSDWISKLTETARTSNASIVGCSHTFAGGEINHRGILVYKNATTEMMRSTVAKNGNYAYVPALSSAVMLVTEPEHFFFDKSFSKYQHDTDICLQAWKQGEKVACALNLEVIHIQGDYMSTNKDFRMLQNTDDSYFQQKWQSFTTDSLYENPELKNYASLAEAVNWEKLYNEATLLLATDPETSVRILREIIENCPYDWRAGSAYYHLYRIEGKQSHLENCIQLYPYHVKAQSELSELIQNKL